MEIRPHFSELLKLLEDNNVEYVIVGGYAMAYHGYPRFTKDIDIFYGNTSENIKRIRTALIGFGFNENDLPEAVFSEQGNIIQFGVVPLRVDIINETGYPLDSGISICTHESARRLKHQRISPDRALKAR